jgi:hypothetical protein
VEGPAVSLPVLTQTRESWVGVRQRAVPQEQLKIPQDAILGRS